MVKGAKTFFTAGLYVLEAVMDRFGAMNCSRQKTTSLTALRSRSWPDVRCASVPATICG